VKKTIKHSLVLVLPILLVAVMFISPAAAASSVVHDPKGDSTAPYLDIVQAMVTEQQGKETLIFMMVLAGPIPEVPSEADLIWPFHVDTNPATSVGPDPNNNYAEYVVRVRWFNGAFVGQVVNRITGVPTSIPFSIDGRTVKVFAPLATLGNPTSFEWNAATRPGATVPYVDFAPDGGLVADLATWTQ